MADSEIESFVRKFKLLRSAGIEASLSLETKLGEVSISLNCKVGRDVLPPPPLVTSKSYRSPSYYRRQARRRAKREDQCLNENSLSLAGQATEEAAEEAATEDETESSIVDDVTWLNDETADSEDEKNEVEIKVEKENMIQSSKLNTDVPDDGIGKQLDSLIRQSRKNRDLWEKFGALPP